nr:hypothetical protein 27 [Elusimicrobiota bacterium]
MANEHVLPEEIHNGPGNWPDADQLMILFEFLNDKVYVSTTPPASPYNFQVWCKSDEVIQTAIRIYFMGNWHAIMIGGIVG